MEPTEAIVVPTSQIDWFCTYEDGSEDWGADKLSLLSAMHKAGVALENISFVVDMSESKDFPDSTPPSKMYFNQVKSDIKSYYSWVIESENGTEDGCNLAMLTALAEQLVDDRINFKAQLIFAD